MRRHLAALAACTVVLAACGIATDTGPRDIPEANQRQLGLSNDSTAGAASGSARIYLVAPAASGQSPTLQAVARNVAETPSAVVTALLAGANATERTKQFRSAIPADERLLSTRVAAGVLHIDLTAPILEVSGPDLIQAVAQLVFTASEVEGVQRIALLVDGQPRRWPTGDGSLQSTPLTVYDYPGLVASAQPAYPAVPSGG